MQHADVVVVGAGLGGLVAGATLAKQGREVLLLERHYIPGGCATSFKRREFVMEVGLHAMDGMDDDDLKRPAFDFLEIDKHIDFVPLPEFYKVIAPNVNCTVPYGIESAIELLGARYPQEKAALEKFFDDIVTLRSEVTRLPVDTWKFNLSLPLFPLLYPKVVKHGEQTLGDYLDKHFTNDELKVILSANLPYYHDDPYSMSMLFFALAQASYYKGGGYYIKGGSQKLSNYLASVISDNGGSVVLAKEVTEIKLEKNRVAGVRYRDALNKQSPEIQVEARNVIVNAPLPLVPDLLPSKPAAKMRKSLQKLQPACSLLSLYIGFNTDLEGLGSKVHSCIISDTPIQDLHKLRDDFQEHDASRCGFAFVDYGQIDSDLTPEGKTFACVTFLADLGEWKDLDDQTYKAKKQYVAETLINRLETHYPGIAEAVEFYEVGTPRTINHYTANPAGTAYGYSQIPSQAGRHRPSRTSSIKGLRFASAWVQPGGGMSGAMIGGYHAALELQKAEKRSHRAHKKAASATQASALLNFSDNRHVRFVSRRTIAADTFELTFEKPENFIPEPGQYAFLALEETDKSKPDIPVRALSILSEPEEHYVRFAMRVSNSPFKQACLAMTPNSKATIYGPTGEFLLPPGPEPLAFIIAGIGITPAVPMIKALHKADFPAPVTLLYSDKTPHSMACREEFAELEHANFNFVPVFTGTDRRIDRSTIEAAIPDYSSRLFYLVGTREFLADMNSALATLGVAHESIRADDFG